jgi:hypothetical protein
MLMRKLTVKPPAMESPASGNRAQPEKSNAGFSRRMDSKNSAFEIMDVEGRGLKYGNMGFWKKKTEAEMLGYCHWLINKHGLGTMTDFNRKAPRAVTDYVRENSLQAQIGLSDRRLAENSGLKRNCAKGKTEKAHKTPAEKPAAKTPAKEASAAKKQELGDPFAPLYSGAPEQSWLNPVRVAPPLPEPRFRLWESAPEFGKEAMVEEFFEAARKGEIYNLEKLLRMGIPVDARNSSGETALMEAAQWRHTKICQTLLESGADPRAVNKHKENALVYAKDGGRKETIELIRKAIRKSR